MVINLIDQKIRKAFSDAATQYDTLTWLHKEIGRELSRTIQECSAGSAVLDIGMGTGWFTKRLADIFPDALVVGLDAAEGMVASAREKKGTFKIVQADASRLPFKKGLFDVITSNLAYQWVGDLTEAFRHSHEQLVPGGTMCFTMFGHDTFRELFSVLEKCALEKKQKNKNVFKRLARKDHVLQSLQEAGFHDARVDSERIKVRFPDMMGMVKWAKDIGANALPKDIYIGRDLLLKANDEYNKQFRDRLGVYATFEVVWVRAVR